MTSGVLALTTRRPQFLVQSGKIAYVEIGAAELCAGLASAWRGDR